MANLPESNTFDEGVYQIETTDPVMGGANGVSNTPLKALANRTRWLKTLLDDVVSKYAPKANPVFTGTPMAPTAVASDSSGQLATTAFVQGAISAIQPNASPSIDGVAAVGASTRLARQDHVHPTDTSRAPIASPAFTGNPTAPTPAVADSSKSLATTEFVKAVVTAGAVGFTPVEQGGGTGQLGNKVRIGWSAAGRLKAQVDSTDLGNLVFDSQLEQFLPLGGGRLSGRLFGTSYFFGESGDDTGFDHPGDGVISYYNNGVNTQTSYYNRVEYSVSLLSPRYQCGAHSDASPGFTFTDDSTTGITHTGPGDIGIKASGVQLMDNNGGSFNVRVPLRSPLVNANTGVNPATFGMQGAYLAWNTSNGGGQTDVVCNRGGGSGGFVFRVLNQDGSSYSVPASIGSDGAMGLSSSPPTSDNSNLVATTAWVRLVLKDLVKGAISAVASEMGFAINLGAAGYIRLPTWLGSFALQWNWWDYSDISGTLDNRMNYAFGMTTLGVVGAVNTGQGGVSFSYLNVDGSGFTARLREHDSLTIGGRLVWLAWGY